MNDLERAMTFKDAHLLKAILPKVAKIDAPLKNDWSPLMFACNFGDLEKVNILLNAGADPCYIASQTFETPCIVVAMATNVSDDVSVEIIGALLRKLNAQPAKRILLVNAKEWTNNMTPLMLAAKTRKPNTIKLLLKAGARVNETDSLGRSALYFGVLARNLTCCRILMEAGADPFQETKEGHSAFTRAQEMGAPLLIEILSKPIKV